MNLACWIMLLGCSAPEETQRQPVESTPSTSTTTPATTTQPVSLSVVVNDNPLSVHHKRFDITADPPATVSVVCTLDTDPEEQHVVQADSASTHALNVFGLLEDSLYRCEILAEGDSGSATVAVDVQTQASAIAFRTWTTETLNAGATSGHYTLFNNWTAGEGEDQVFILVDPEGRRRWVWTPDPTLGPAIEMQRYDQETWLVGGGRGLPPTLLSLANEVVWSGPKATGSDAYHHDVALLPWGDVLALVEVVNTDGNGNEFLGFALEAFTPISGQRTWSFNSQTAVDSGTLLLRDYTGGDEWHANAIQYVEDAEGPAVYVSLAYADRIVRVDWNLGDVTWNLGARSDFRLFDASGNEITDDQPRWFYGQHDPEAHLPRMFVYDNGVNRPDVDPPFSRLIELDVDVVARTARVVWEYLETGWYEPLWGSVDLLPNGNVLLGQGHCSFCPDNQGRRTAILEMVPGTGEIVWRLDHVEAKSALYRAHRYDGCDLFANLKYCPNP